MSDDSIKPDKVPDFVTSQAALGNLLGVHRNTILAWAKEPDAPKGTPKGYNVAKWLDFASEIAKRANVEKSDTKKQLEIEKLKETIRGLRQKNDEEERLLIRIDLATEKINTLVSELNQEIRKIEDGRPQALLGLGLPEQRVKIREAFDALRLKIHKGEKGITEH